MTKACSLSLSRLGLFAYLYATDAFYSYRVVTAPPAHSTARAAVRVLLDSDVRESINHCKGKV
eukprot:scaffold313165_cov55-Prasinocladus_malaysianus.AAC.1